MMDDRYIVETPEIVELTYDVAGLGSRCLAATIDTLLIGAILGGMGTPDLVPGFESRDVLVVRAWLVRRSVEPAPQAAALIKFPRMWSTKRGRYCNFSTPGATFGLMRARPTF